MDNLALVSLKPNESGTIKEISGCCNAKKRLYELGLHKGASVKMIKNDFGPIILSLAGHKLALGRGIASHVFVNH